MTERYGILTLIEQHPLRTSRRGWYGPLIEGPGWIARPTCGQSMNSVSEHIDRPAKLLDYFLRSNKSNINQIAASLLKGRYPQGRAAAWWSIFLNDQPTEWAGEFFEESEGWRLRVGHFSWKRTQSPIGPAQNRDVKKLEDNVRQGLHFWHRKRPDFVWWPTITTPFCLRSITNNDHGPGHGLAVGSERFTSIYKSSRYIY